MKIPKTKGTVEGLVRLALALMVFAIIASPASTQTALPDLSLVTTTPIPTPVGGNVTWTVNIRNAGAAPTPSGVPVVVESTLSPSLRYVSAGGGNAFACYHDGSPKGGVVTCTSPGPLPAGSTAAITFVASPNGDSCTMSSATTVDPKNTIRESNETNNSVNWAQRVTQGCPPDLIIEGSAQGSIPVGGTLIYQLKVKNVGGKSAGAFDIRAQLSSGVRYRAGSPAGSTCSHDGSGTGGVVTCKLLGLTAGSEIPLSLGMDVTGSLCTITNQAVVDSGNSVPEDNEQNNGATSSTNVSGPCGLPPPTSTQPTTTVSTTTTSTQPNALISGTYKVENTNSGTTYVSTWTLEVSGNQITGTSDWPCCPGRRLDPLRGSVAGNRVTIARDCRGQGYVGECRQEFVGTIVSGVVQGKASGTGAAPNNVWTLYLRPLGSTTTSTPN